MLIPISYELKNSFNTSKFDPQESLFNVQFEFDMSIIQGYSQALKAIIIFQPFNTWSHWQNSLVWMSQKCMDMMTGGAPLNMPYV